MILHSFRELACAAQQFVSNVCSVAPPCCQHEPQVRRAHRNTSDLALQLTRNPVPASQSQSCSPQCSSACLSAVSLAKDPWLLATTSRHLKEWADTEGKLRCGWCVLANPLNRIEYLGTRPVRFSGLAHSGQSYHDLLQKRCSTILGGEESYSANKRSASSTNPLLTSASNIQPMTMCVGFRPR